MLRATIAVLVAIATCTTASAATSRYRPITSLKVKPSFTSSARFKINPVFARPAMGGFRQPFNRAGGELNPQPLPPGPPPQSRMLGAPKIQPLSTVRSR